MQTEKWEWRLKGAAKEGSVAVTQAESEATARRAALLCTEWMQAWESPETWRAFSRTETAHEMRKLSPWGGAFVEWGEQLQRDGLRTAFLSREDDRVTLLSVHRPLPQTGAVLGQTVYDYYDTLLTPLPRALGTGIEVLWREGQAPHLSWIAHFESEKRPLSLSEGLAISGVAAEQLQDAAFLSIWIAAWIHDAAESVGLGLRGVQLEWALSPSGDLFLSRPVTFDRLQMHDTTYEFH